MQSITEDYASDDANSSCSNMSISSYSLASNASTPPLQYPKYDIPNRVELPDISTLRFAKVEDHKAENKDKPILSPAPFTPMSPAQIQVDFDEPAGPDPISATENKTTAANDPVSDSTTLIPEEENPIDNWDLSDLASAWDEDRDQEYHDTWPSPPRTPVDGDDMHPPSLDRCGDFPSEGWDFNELLSSHYHRLLIPSPVGK